MPHTGITDDTSTITMDHPSANKVVSFKICYSTCYVTVKFKIMPKYSIKNTIIYLCDAKNCEYVTNNKTNMVAHKSRRHNINIIWHQCDICIVYRGKTKGDLKQHKADVHNIDVKLKC